MIRNLLRPTESRRAVSRRGSSRSSLILMGAMLSTAAHPCFAASNPANRAPISFSMPSQDMESALLAFAKTANIQLIINTSELKGLTAPAIVGRYTPAEALAHLLRASVLDFKWTGPNTLAIRRQPLLHPAAQRIESPVQSTAASEASPSAAGIEDIVVTAQKRSENLQKTPLAVTAVSGAALTAKGITSLVAAQELVPGARFQQQGNSVQVFLRGVGSNLDNPNVTPAVAFNFNGVSIPREGTSTALFDIDRFEVLPGPQGTLYGRSAIGGVINVGFRKPVFENVFSLDVEAGNYDLAHGTTVANIAASDTLAFRAAVDYAYRDGYMTSGADSQDNLAGRLSVLYRPNSDFSAYVWGYYAVKNGAPANIVNKGSRASYNAQGQINGLTFDEGAYLTKNPWHDRYPDLDPAFAALIGASTLAPFGQPTKPTQDYDHWALGGEFNLKLNDTITLTYIPGYVFVNATSNIYWLGNLPGFNRNEARYNSQELRLSGKSASLDWLLGVYAYHRIQRGAGVLGTATGEFGPAIPDTPFPFYSTHVLNNRLKGIAVFGQGTYEIAVGLKFTVGARYGTDSTKGSGISLDDQITPYSYDRSMHRFDFKIAAQYDLTPDVMIYAQYQTGYQPNTFNEITDLPGRSNHVKPATLKALSGGIKARLLDNTLQINDEIFYSDYRNFEVQAYDTTKLFNAIFNAGKVTIPGNQLDIIWQPTPEDRLNLSVSYIHARNKDFVTPAGDSFNGLSPGYAADWTIAGALSHDFRMQSGYVRAAADARFESKWWADYVHNPGTMQGSNVIVNASVIYYSDNGRWSAGIWGRNLTNEAVLAAAAAAGVPGPAVGFLAAPRTYGIRMGVNF
jgi:iron complex outermembrane recepter protein